MQPTHHDIQSKPVFPAPLSLPLKMIPAAIHSRALVSALNRLFIEELNNGELDFLQHKIIQRLAPAPYLWCAARGSPPTAQADPCRRGA